MASQVHGTFGTFDSSQEHWCSYTERLQQYFTANDVRTAEKQRAILLSGCGASTYQLIRNLVAPAKPVDRTFAEIVKLVQDHHQPPPSAIVQRFNFHSRSRRQGESVSAFVAELRKLSEYCQFGDTLSDMIRDRLVCGINDQKTQRRLLAETTLTYEKAFTLAQALEAADKSAKELEKASGIHAVFPQSRPPHATTTRPPQTTTSRPHERKCYRCGGTNHASSECRFKDSDCLNCGKKGHIARVCRSRGKQPQQTQRPQSGRRPMRQPHSTHHVEEDDDVDPVYTLFHMSARKPSPMLVTLQLNQAPLQMEIDTGASASLISERTYRTLWPSDCAPPLQPSDIKLRTYTGEELTVLGRVDVAVLHDNHRANLSILVVPGTGPSLLGRDWMHKIRLDWDSLHQVQCDSLQSVLARHETAFRDELGEVKDATAKVHIDPSVPPRFCKARTVPYALRPKVEKELERLERDGVIEPVQFSEWAAPIVPVMKRDGSIRICGDYKITVNRASHLDTFPLPRIDDLFASLSGGKKFTKLDLAHAYQQIPLDEESRKLVVINTQKGLFRYNRLPFGIASAPAIFQRTIEGVLQGIPHVCVYIDDILITGRDDAEHLKILDAVLSRLEAAGMRLKKGKCEYMKPSVEYLGHIISADGLRPTQEKVRAISDAPAPKDVSQLRSFLGMVNYYGKFLCNLSSTLAPLYRLLENKTPWSWGQLQEKAFREAKTQLTSTCLLVHFDPQKKLVLACDASPYGVGAVLSHEMGDGSEQPVAFASRSLSPAEKKYSQLEKEGLSIIFAVKKFHDYLLGRKFHIMSDHKPLQHLFSASRPVPPLASARIQRWALTLGAYDYDLAYKPGKDHGNADTLSRLPLPESAVSTPVPGELVLVMDTLDYTAINATQIRQWTARDPLTAQVREMVLQGWQEVDTEELRPYQRKKDELSVQDGCLLWGTRVVVPAAGRSAVLDELHQSHPGVARMKSLGRSFVWWPGFDHDIEEKVKECLQCQLQQKSPAKAPHHPWEWPDRPWARLHIDHAGPFLGKTFLVLVDAQSKWLEVMIVSSTTSQSTIRKLQSIFATHGLPEMIVSDNGTAFTSAEFQQFAHPTTPPRTGWPREQCKPSRPH